MRALHRLHYSDSVTPIMYCFIDGEERETGLTNIIWAVSQQFLSAVVRPLSVFMG